MHLFLLCWTELIWLRAFFTASLAKVILVGSIPRAVFFGVRGTKTFEFHCSPHQGFRRTFTNLISIHDILDISHMINYPVTNAVFLYWNFWFAKEGHQQTTTDMLESAKTPTWFHIQVCWQSVRGASAFKIIKHSSSVPVCLLHQLEKTFLCHFCLNMLRFSPVTHLQWLKYETSCSVMLECSDHCWINKHFCFNKKLIYCSFVKKKKKN